MINANVLKEKSMKEFKTLNVRLTPQEHSVIKAYSFEKNITISDLIKATLFEKINAQTSSETDLLVLLKRINAIVERSALVSESALVAACRYQIGSTEDLTGIGMRRSQAIAAAKNWITKEI